MTADVVPSAGGFLPMFNQEDLTYFSEVTDETRVFDQSVLKELASVATTTLRIAGVAPDTV
jgi:hypothetical protein